MKWEHYLRVQTQNPQFLWRMVTVVLAAGLVLGFMAQFWPKANSIENLAMAIAQESGVMKQLAGLLDDEDIPFEHILEALAYVSPNETDTRHVTDLLTRASLAENRRALLQQLWTSMAAGKPTAELKQLADAAPQIRFANHALAEFYVSQDDYMAAAGYFEIEGQLPDAKIARQKAVDMYGLAENVEALARLAGQPEYQPFISSYDQLSIAKSRRDWRAMFWIIPRALWERVKFGAPTVLAIIAGLFWFILALQLGQAKTDKGVRWWLCALAVPLGCLSIWPAHFFDYWQELALGLEDSAELIEGIKFYVLSVGLREELSKLLLLLPLMPWIVRRGNALEALIVSACVGLGFAILENSGYFARSGGANTMGRFLTANFAHMALTGLIGLAVARAFWSPQRNAGQAAVVFLVVVLAHGFYDAVIAIPVLFQYSMAGTIIFILLSYIFFHELRQLRSGSRETISLTATFLFTVSTLTAVTFVYLCSQIGFRTSGQILFSDVTSLGAMVYMYLREIPNSLLR